MATKKTPRQTISNNVSLIVSVVAIFVSIAAALFAYLQFRVDKGHETYEFWQHVNGSLIRQQRIAQQLPGKLIDDSVRIFIVLQRIHHGQLDCEGLRTGILRRYARKVGADNVKGRYFLAEMTDSGAFVTENAPMAHALNILGWQRLVEDEKYSENWWLKIAQVYVTSQALLAHRAFDCLAVSRKGAIKVSAQDAQLLKRDAKMLAGDILEIRMYGGPNIMAIENLESENGPDRQLRWNHIRATLDALPKVHIGG